LKTVIEAGPERLRHLLLSWHRGKRLINLEAPWGRFTGKRKENSPYTLGELYGAPKLFARYCTTHVSSVTAASQMLLRTRGMLAS